MIEQSASALIDAKIASLDAGTRRAIDLNEGDRIDSAAFRALAKGAIAIN